MAISKVVSIEITDVVTRICEIGYNKKNPIVYKSLILDNPEHAVDDGFVGESAGFGAFLKDKLSEAGINSKNAVFSIASNKILSREITIPEMKEDLIGGLIDSERGEYFPMDTTGFTMTFHIVSHNKETKQMRVIVFAAPEQLISNYQALALAMGLKIVAFDCNGNSLYQYLHRNTAEPMDLYLQINERNSLFTILDNNTFELQRNMNFGTENLVQTLMETGYYGDIDKAEAPEKFSAETLIYPSFSAMVDTVPEGEEAARLHELRRKITDSCRPLIGNISRVLEYYNTRKRDAVINKIYIGGAGAGLQGLKELIESEFTGIEVEIVNVLPGVNIHKDNSVCAERSTEFISCIGAAYPSINFYRVDEATEKSQKMVFWLIALVVVLAASAAIVYNGWFNYNQQVKRQETLKKKQAELEAQGIEAIERDYYSAIACAEELTAMDESTFTYNENWNEILSYLESESVAGITVGSLSSGNSGLIMNVTVGSKEEAAKLVMQLRKIPYFDSVQINGFSENVDEETLMKSVSFSVYCTYKKPAAADTEETEVSSNEK